MSTSALSAPSGGEERALAAAGSVYGYSNTSTTLRPSVEQLEEKSGPLAPESSFKDVTQTRRARLELQDGLAYEGFSFGAERSVSGELVFQTGMVGYPESITDPSYRGQILVITFPLVGNYGVPSRKSLDSLLDGLPAHFEASQIHVAGLIVASYAGEDYSHHLATSSLGTWLKEENVPAIFGVDTRALTKRIRQEGSMLGQLLVENDHHVNGLTNGLSHTKHQAAASFDKINWVDPNALNLVADGRLRFEFADYG